MKKYIAARPETIVSILQFGRLPEKLPAYLEGSQLILFDTISQALVDVKTVLDQVFILEINIHSSTVISIDAVEKIICYSERGNNLLQRLLNNFNLPAIEIDPAVFTLPQTTHKHALEGLSTSTVSPIKKSRTVYENSSSTLFQPSPQSAQKRERSAKLIERLSSPNEHVVLLIKAMEVVQKTLLITSYDISHAALLRINFYIYLERALSRGVKVYIYYNDMKGADKEALNIFSRLENVLCSEAFTHSKFLCVDDLWVSIGSYNWLSFHPEARANERKEGTIVCYQRELNKQMIQDIWNHLRFYRHLQFDNHRALRRFDANMHNHSTVSYPLAVDSELEYIPTLEQHCAFFQEVLRKAKSKLIICSPFLSIEQCLEDIRKRDLRSLSQRGVQIYIVTSSQSQDYKALEKYLAKINSETIYLIDQPNFHLKTLIIDDKVIAEGSFNWLSATRFEESDFHNHEATLIARGRAALELIEDFYQSPIGQEIKNIQAQTPYSTSSATR